MEGLTLGLVLGLVFGFVFPEECRSPFGLALVLISSVLGMEAYLGMAFVYGVSVLGSCLLNLLTCVQYV